MSDPFAPSIRLGLAVDQIPPGPGEVEFEELTRFNAYVKTSRIDTRGELVITLGIPYEDKYEAMPITDLRGIQFLMIACQPKLPAHDDGG